MFAYCGNNPTCLKDTTGQLSEFCMIAFNSDDYYSVEGLIIVALGCSIKLNEGHICMDMDSASEDVINLSEKISIADISQVLASIACFRYDNQYGKEFLLSNKCVGIEIEDHINAYYWATGYANFPNYLVVGFLALNFLNQHKYDATSVYNATRYIDIRESDVVANGGLSSQASVFGYKDGIRDIYIGTERDPWASTR